MSEPEGLEVPQGELMLRTLAMPADTNPNGDIFGGWLLAQMDIAGGLAAKARARNRVATVAVEAMTFHRPVFVGDVVCCYADFKRVGRTSMTVGIQVWVLRQAIAQGRVKVTEGVFVYVSIDDQRRPLAIELTENRAYQGE
ncbi:MAG: acyl-CoA thioesterase [Candidatus Competibacterales bacterium]